MSDFEKREELRRLVSDLSADEVQQAIERARTHTAESLKRDDDRRNIAVEIAEETYGSDDVEIDAEEWEGRDGKAPAIESVDGGYWIRARIWVDADEVEGRMST